MHKPIISVIIPIYKVEQYLRQCLDSVKNQTLQDFEVLMVNDGSPDNCGAIMEEYAAADSRFRPLFKENGGLSSARNYGIDRASGDWIIFLDSDDYYTSSDALLKLYQSATTLDADIVRFEYQAVKDSGDVAFVRDYSCKRPFAHRILDNQSMIRNVISGEWFSVLYLIKLGCIGSLRFNEDRKFQEDIEFYARLFNGRNLKCAYLPEKYYAYRKREESITTTSYTRWFYGSMSLGDMFYDETTKAINDSIKEVYLYNSVMMYYWTMDSLSSDQYYHLRSSILKDPVTKSYQQNASSRCSGIKLKRFEKFIIRCNPKTALIILRGRRLTFDCLYDIYKRTLRPLIRR